MKTLKRLNLVQLSKDELKEKEMTLLKGGYSDCCGCGEKKVNRDANSSAGYGHSSTGNASCHDWNWNGKEWDHSKASECN